ncbi:MAG: S-layer y protein, partial [Frankiales bacterium]|nr:S-layer y protein [Frankiales bacterium]
MSVRLRRPVAGAACLFLLGAGSLAGAASATADTGSSPFVASRADAPVVLTGAQIPQWSGPAADGVAAPYPSGSLKADGGDGVRSAHNGTMVIPPATGVDPDQVSAWKWNGTAWAEVPVQVDQKFPYFLANGHSDFAFYSGTDKELTYAWAPDKHATGEEAWKKIFGDCSARYASTDPVTQAADITTASKTSSAAPLPAYSPAAGETPADYTHAMQDPVPTLDNDDEIAFQAGDAGGQAPAAQAAPAGTTAGSGQTVAVADPTSGAIGYVYLFLKPGGSSFDASNGYVKMTRDANADQWMDRDVFKSGSTQQLGSSNTGYGPNLQGTVCQDANGPTAPRFSKDRFPSDAVTVTTDRYKLRATGRWMVRDYSVAKPVQPNAGTVAYGPDLIDRWKGRAFQQSPDSSVSVVGFEDEQVNWEANGALLGWRQGPVRAIREIWGADSGTNVTKTETYYKNADTYRYHVRVHPIPPDGLYTSWDYNKNTASTYYNTLKPAGVPIDGVNDDTGQFDQVPVAGNPAFVDTPDPSFDLMSAVDRPEEVAGKADAGA